MQAESPFGGKGQHRVQDVVTADKVVEGRGGRVQRHDPQPQ
jgi:hypothetical protein